MNVLPMPSRDRADLLNLVAQAAEFHTRRVDRLIEIAENALARARQQTPEPGDVGVGAPARRKGAPPAVSPGS